MNNAQWSFIQQAVREVERGRAKKLEMHTDKSEVKIYRVDERLTRIDILGQEPEETSSNAEIQDSSH